MKQRAIRYLGVTESMSKARSLLAIPGDAVLVKREVLRSFVMACPDGCGEPIIVNLDPRTDKAWRLYQTDKGYTLFPSVWRDTGCGSHFILWNNAVYWLEAGDPVRDLTPNERKLDAKVYRLLLVDRPRSFVELADELHEIPWDVLDACRRLRKQGQAIEGSGNALGQFKRIGAAASKPKDP